MYKSKTGIRVSGVKKSYVFYVHSGLFKRKKVVEEAVKDVSFEVKSGEILGIVGANGAGKTTIIKMAAGVMKQDEGTIFVNQENPFLRTKNYRKDVAIILGQKGKLHPDMSIYEAAELYGSMYGYARETAICRIDEMACRLSLDKEYLKKQTRALSLGQRMKGEICVALINRPNIIFLDEPTLGLDSKSAKGIRKYLVEYCREEKASIILTSHDIRDIQETCSKLMIIKKGMQLFYGAIEELPMQFAKNGSDSNRELMTPKDFEEMVEEILDHA